MLLLCPIAYGQDTTAYSVIRLTDDDSQPISEVIVLIKSSGSQSYKGYASGVDGSVVLNEVNFPIAIKIEDELYKEVDTILQAFEGTQQLMLKHNYNVLNNIIFTGVARPTKVDDAIAVYQVITEASIKARGAVTLNDAIRTEMGLNISQDQMLGTNISMRGLAGNNVKILIDGLPVNGRENGNIDLSQFNLNNIERIEKVQGPMSVMYGSDALGGVINLITKKQKQKFSAGINTYLTSIQNYNFGGNVGYSHIKHSASLHAGRNYFTGWDPHTPISQTRSPLWRPKELYFANFKYTYKLTPTNSISFSSDYSQDQLVLKSDTIGFADNPTARRLDTRIFTTRWHNRLQGKFLIGKNGYLESSNAYAYYNRDRKGYMVDLTTMDNLPSANSSDNTQTTFKTLTSRTTYNNRVKNIEYTLGYDINSETGEGTDKIAAGTKTINDYALFTTIDYTIAEKIKIQPALRWSYNTVFKTPLVPSLGIRYAVNDSWKLRFNYANGFRAPNLKELYLLFNDANHDIIGNPNLSPEKGHHLQVSSAFTLIDKDMHNSVLSVTGMYDDVRDQIMLGLVDPQGSTLVLPQYSYINVAHLRYFTVQAKNTYTYKNVLLDVGGSWNKNIPTSAVLKDGSNYTSPEFSFLELNTSASYLVKKYDLTFSAFYKYTGRQRIIGADIMGGAIFGDYMDGFSMLDASIQKDFFKNHLTMIIGCRNAFNIQRIATATGTVAAAGHGATSSANVSTGRNFFINLRWTL